jgi:hypothetical protein
MRTIEKNVTNRKLYLRWLVLLCVFLASNVEAQYDRGESSGDYSLPVSLLSFSASGGEHAITLSWVTASEIDVVGFNVHRSNDLEGVFTRINPALIPSQGSGPGLIDYQYIDDGVAAEILYYYRLSSVELDGSEVFIGSTVTGSISATIGDPCIAFKGSYPDPFNSQVSIAFSVKVEGRVSLMIHDVSGRKIAAILDRFLAPGEYVETFSGDWYSSGVYLCRVQGGNGYQHVHKMILLR